MLPYLRVPRIVGGASELQKVIITRGLGLLTRDAATPPTPKSNS